MLLLSCALTLLVWSLTAADKPICSESDYHYEYTECDSKGGRWRVYVPKDADKCSASDKLSKPPIRGKSCTFTCAPGQYMDVQGDQECHQCAAGTFSLGGGERYDDFEQLPPGFSTSLVPFTGVFDGATDAANCTDIEGWKAHSSWLSVFAVHCTAALKYTVKLVKAGRLQFQYLHQDAPGTLFTVRVRTEHCDAADASRHSFFLRPSRDTPWVNHVINLDSGLNVITWEVRFLSNVFSKSVQRTPILIRRIEVDGVAYSSTCTACPAGSYSSAGSSDCLSCPANTLSLKSAEKCTDCNKELEYSVPGSEKCTKRPACTEADYFEYLNKCDENEMAEVMYKWIEPQICLPSAAESVRLPASGAKRKCPACNPGFQRLANGTCEQCASGSFSAGGDKCAPCPPGSLPHRGLFATGWRTMPSHLEPSCMSLSESGCATVYGWELKGDYVTSGAGHADDTDLVLTLNIPGLEGSSSSANNEISRITFVFETSCKGPCRFYFLQEDSLTNEADIIVTFEGSKTKQQYSYSITSAHNLKYMWVFDRKPFEEESEPSLTYHYPQDQARIYTVNVTNVKDAGADVCLKCESSDGKSCVHCPEGTEQMKNSTKCSSCQKNWISRRNKSGRNKCEPCAEGLKSKDHKTCHSDCQVSLPDGRSIDLRPINKLTLLYGQTTFSQAGSPIIHAYNISLCGKDGQPQASCVNNMTGSVGSIALSSFICRVTLIPGSGAIPSVSAQPFVIASHLLSVSLNASHAASGKSLLYNLTHIYGYDVKEDDVLTRFTYHDSKVSSVCKSGRRTEVIVVCDLTADGSFQLSPKCPEGTCDGCEYMFLVRTPHGCPLCRLQDYQRIEGACKFGKQSVFITPPSSCYNATGKSEISRETQACPLLPLEAVIGIAVAAVLALVLLVLLVKFHRRNRNLEYKYMKLVESTGRGGEPGELPAAETCGLSDTSEDEGETNSDFDQVAFHNQSGRGFFSRVAKANKGIKTDDFESVRLTDSKI